MTQSADSSFRDTIETPFAVGLGIFVHKEIRNKKMIQYISDLGLSIPYNKVIRIENGLENAIIEKKKSNNGIYIPANLRYNSCLHFAIDNNDFRNDTADGKGEFHGTTQVVFQKKQSLSSTDHIQITPTKSLAFQHAPDTPLPCMKPKQPNERYEGYIEPSSFIDLSTITNHDRFWTMLQITNNLTLCPLPTWSAFNSLI